MSTTCALAARPLFAPSAWHLGQQLAAADRTPEELRLFAEGRARTEASLRELRDLRRANLRARSEQVARTVAFWSPS